MAFEEEKRRRKALEEKLDLFKTEVVYCFLFLWIVSLHGKCDFDLEPTTYKHGTDYISPPQLRSCGGGYIVCSAAPCVYLQMYVRM